MDDRELRILTRGVVNPDGDRRRRHGIESITVFPAGTRFLFSKGTEDIRCLGWVEVIDGQENGFTHSPKVVEALLEASEQCAPNDWRSICAAVTGNRASGWLAVAVLDRLIAEGGEIMRRAIEAAILDADK